jgi:PAS domain S-box-containing protein
MEFFSPKILPPDEELLQTVTTLGNQIGQFIEKMRAEEELRENEMRLSATIASALDAIISMDHEGRIIDFNPAAETIFGCAQAEVIGRPLEETIIPPSLRERHRTKLSSYLTTGKAHILGQRIEITGLRADGTEFPVELTVTRIPTAGPPVFTGYIRDISERVRARQILEQRVEERTRELATLLDVSQIVASTLDLQPLLSLILDQLKLMVDYGSATIAVYQDQDLVVCDYRGPLPREMMVDRRHPMDQLTILQNAVHKREPVIVADLLNDGYLARQLVEIFADRYESIASSLRSWMAVPLVSRDRVIGVISLDHSRPDFFTVQQTRVVLAVAEQAAIAIENATLYHQAQELAALEERQRLARELHDSVLQALFGIGISARTARLVFHRDPEQALKSIDVVLTLVRTGMAEMRALIFELRPESLEAEGLVGALRKQSAAVSGRAELPIQLILCDEPIAPLPVKEAVFRIAQEALLNVVKHAQANQVDLHLDCVDGEIVLEVRDDGIGLDTEPAKPGHLGLHSMRERAARFGGTVEIKRVEPAGTTVRARIPYGDARADRDGH